MHKTTNLTGALIAALIIAGCGEDPRMLANWEHSHTGLYNAAISEDGQFAVISSSSDGASFWNLSTNFTTGRTTTPRKGKFHKSRSRRTIHRS
jgi:hypothetical protein